MNDAPDPTREDKRQAGAINTSISTYVATAALAVLAGTVVLFTYVTQTYTADAWFYSLVIAGVAALVVAIFLGGKGSGKVAASVGAGTYDPATKNQWFNWQAILTLVGLVLVLVATAVGMTERRQTSSVQREVDSLKTRIAVLEGRPRAR